LCFNIQKPFFIYSHPTILFFRKFSTLFMEYWLPYIKTPVCVNIVIYYVTIRTSNIFLNNKWQWVAISTILTKVAGIEKKIPALHVYKVLSPVIEISL
jgi:hypothetical protein